MAVEEGFALKSEREVLLGYVYSVVVSNPVLITYSRTVLYTLDDDAVVVLVVAKQMEIVIVVITKIDGVCNITLGIVVILVRTINLNVYGFLIGSTMVSWLSLVLHKGRLKVLAIVKIFICVFWLPWICSCILRIYLVLRHGLRLTKMH